MISAAATLGLFIAQARLVQGACLRDLESMILQATVVPEVEGMRCSAVQPSGTLIVAAKLRTRVRPQPAIPAGLEFTKVGRRRVRS